MRIFLLTFLTLFFGIGYSVFAHSDGNSFERTVGNVLIDIGYSEEEIAAGEQVNFDFNIYDAQTGEAVAFTDAWVRVEHNRNTFFAGGIHRPPLGATTMMYQFPDAGTYTFAVRFQNELETVAESEFDVTVGEREEDQIKFVMLLIIGVLAVLSGYVVAYFCYLRSRNQQA